METIDKFLVDDSFSITQIEDKIPEQFTIAVAAEEKVVQRLYDTFDWRLFHQKKLLLEQGNNLFLLDLADSRLNQSLKIDRNQILKFWWDFPESNVKKILKDILDVRALMFFIEVEKKGQKFNVLNRDQKTVIRICVEKIYGWDKSKERINFSLVNLKLIRGYDSEFLEFKNIFLKIGINQKIENEFIYALSALKMNPGEYSSKIKLQLEPEMTANAAAKKIFQFLLRTIKQNERGIKADIDTEFLHDFRVAVRRTRSALTQIKHVFQPDVTDRFKKEFSKLGQMTNLMRDLDVYLLNKNNYQKMLSPELRPGLDLLFENLATQRKIEHAKIIAVLSEKDYKELLNEWEIFLNSANQPDSKSEINSDEPILNLAKAFISKRYAKILLAGKKIKAVAPDKALHSLRIQCKKLRYLLEFFSSLFPPEEINQLISQHKNLQQNLGDFNDYSMQQENLREYLAKIDLKQTDAITEAAAIGGLIALLYQRQKETRAQFEKIFENFSNRDNSALYEKLFL